MGYSIFWAADGSVEFGLSVEKSRVLERSLEAVTGFVSANRVLAAVEVVETRFLLLLEDEKAKARTAGVSCRLVKQNIQRTMDRLRAAKTAEDVCGDGIQVSFEYLAVKGSIKQRNGMISCAQLDCQKTSSRFGSIKNSSSLRQHLRRANFESN